MSRRLTFLLLGLLCAGALAAGEGGQVQEVKSSRGQEAEKAHRARVLELRLDDMIHPVMVEYLERGFVRAEETDASLILITMNTPGGLDSSMREIIKRIIHSKIPVAVYVSPSGSRAASAGFFVLLSADVAAMAPGTDTGAASPVFIIGGQSAQVDETMKRKVTNEAAAYLRSIVGKRGRNVEVAELAVTEAKAFSDSEALKQKLVDFVAPSTEELLARLDGHTITRFDGATLKLELAQPVVTRHEMTERQRFLSRIVRPDVFFILLIVGVLGLYTEFTHPGLILPGVVGGISMVLALFAMHVLPINVTGLLLILLALALFILEAKVASHGILAIGGAVSMVLGALMLIRSPLTGMGVSLGAALGATIPFAILTVFLMRLVLESLKWKQSVGAEPLVGQFGEVTETIDGKGMIFVSGELWRAAARERIPKGARVRVTRVEGLTLHVEPAAGESADAARDAAASS
jgi:membrane-bound serine protease (ClpP class)